jgi:hypothetical protein
MTWVVNGLAFLGALIVVMLFCVAISECVEACLKARAPKVVEVRVRDEVQATKNAMLEAAIEERVSSIIDSRATTVRALPLSAEDLLDHGPG